MKKYIAIALMLLLCCSALAEGMTPAMFLGSRGLMVLDQNQLNSMSSQDETESDDSWKILGEYPLAVFSVPSGENSTPTIMFSYDGIVYAAFEMTAMFGQGTMDGKGMSQVFVDLCSAYDFDIYWLTIDGGDGFFYAKDMGQWKSLILRSGGSENAGAFASHRKESKEEFIEAVKTTFE